MAFVCWLGLRDPFTALPRATGNPVAIEFAAAPLDGRTLQHVVLEAPMIGRIGLAISLPDPLPERPLPIVMVVGGLATGERNIRHIPGGVPAPLICRSASYFILSATLMAETSGHVQLVQRLPTKTGTVSAQGSPAKQVACGGKRPAAADTPKPQFDHAPAAQDVLAKDTVYTAVIQTSCGTIKIQLDTATAPQTAASFVFLADKGFFDGLFFHRVVDSIDVIQTGDPLGTGSGGPGYTIPDELTGKEHYTAGTVAMANGGANTGGSQFFIITGPQGVQLPPQYSLFGQVTNGIDVVNKIAALAVPGAANGEPKEKVTMDSVTIQES